MEKKKTFFEVICPYKLSAKDIIIALWFCISIAMLSVSDDAPVWFIILDCANFALSAYCLKFIKLKDSEEE